MPNVAEIDKAIAAHATWKVRLRTVITTGHSSISVEQVRADKGCDFGKWLHGSGAPRGRNDASHAEVTRLHAEFHKAAARVAELALAGKKQEAEAAMGAFGEFGTASSKLTAAMVNWKKQGP